MVRTSKKKEWMILEAVLISFSICLDFLGLTYLLSLNLLGVSWGKFVMSSRTGTEKLLFKVFLLLYSENFCSCRI